MNKIFILDTNVVLHDPNAVFDFADNEIIIPITVIEELDEMKKRQDEVGRNSRNFSRILEKLSNGASMSEPIQVKGGGVLRVEIDHQERVDFPSSLHKISPDNRILALASYYKSVAADKKVILVSKDLNLRIKAQALGITAEDYEKNKVYIDTLYSGVIEPEVEAEDIDSFYKTKKIAKDFGMPMYPNQFAFLHDKDNPSHSALCRYNSTEKSFGPLINSDKVLWGIKAKNKEQRFAIDALLDDSIMLVTLVGIAGTGKTLLALAAGLEKVLEEKKYKRLLVSRPIVAMGHDIGYLPGDVDEKLMPRMRPIQDNLEFLFENMYKEDESGNALLDLLEKGIVELEPLTYIRGRSIPNQFIIVDEAQNLTPHELKTIITRAGHDTKIVLTGDPYQIDHPYLDSNSTGLSHVVERFKGQELFAHVSFRKGERSKLAELAANLL